MPKTRCPYCVEDGQFKHMIGQGKGDWFICARCGHLAMPGNPHSRCTCAHCVRLEQPTTRMTNRKRHR